MKKRAILIALLTAAILLVLPGCASENTDIQSLLPRENVTQVAVDFLGVGVGENIPRVRYEAASADGALLLDALYAAQSVKVEIPETYSPELNASHEVFLTTQAGTMSLYYDDYQNILSVPINRKAKDQTVRVYLSFRPAELAQLLSAWQESLAPQEPDPAPQGQPDAFPPDDAQLRQSVDTTLFDLVGQPLSFEPSAYAREGEGALYYALDAQRRPELAADQMLVVAEPGSGETRQASIAEIVENDYYILVRVTFADAAQGETPAPAAVLCKSADLQKGKPILFLDAENNILYAQAALGAASPSAAPSAPAQEPSQTAAATPAPSAPSDASGGEEGDGEPLQP